MSLRKIHIEKLSKAITAHFAAAKGLKGSEDLVTGKISSIISTNMDEERQIEDEAYNLLQKNRKSIGTDLDEQKAVLMIKKQLAKQRGFVL